MRTLGRPNAACQQSTRGDIGNFEIGIVKLIRTQAKRFENFVRINAKFSRNRHDPKQRADAHRVLVSAAPTPPLGPLVSGGPHSLISDVLLSGFGKILSYSVNSLKPRRDYSNQRRCCMARRWLNENLTITRICSSPQCLKRISLSLPVGALPAKRCVGRVIQYRYQC